MKSNLCISKRLFLVGAASIIVGLLEKPICAAPAQFFQVTQTTGEVANAEVVRNQFRPILFLIALKLNSIPPAQRLSYFYNVKTRFFGSELQAESPNLDTSVRPDGTYTDQNTAILVNHLFVNGETTPDGIAVFQLAQFLLQAPTIVADFNKDFSKTTTNPQKLKKWSDNWVSNADVTTLDQINEQASKLVLTLEPLGVEERAQLLCKIASIVSPEAGKAYHEFYSADKVKALHVQARTQTDLINTEQPDIPTTTPEEPAPPGVSNDLFDDSVEKLPPGFVGNDMNRLVQPLTWYVIGSMTKNEGKIKPKDEFETTTSYLRRVNLTVAESMGLKDKWTDESTFVSTLNDRRNLSEYNADKGELKINLSLLSQHSFEFYRSTREAPVSLTMEWKNIEQFPHGNYIPENTWLSAPTIWLNDVSLKMNPDEARQAKENLNILFSFRLTSHEFVAHGPIELVNGLYTTIISDKALVGVTIKQIWIFNSKTGQIYSKIVTNE